MRILGGKEDFEWYKKSLDVDIKYEHDHHGEPKEYPCQVASRFFDDPNGPYTYYHTFSYQRELVCCECGNRSIIWPNNDTDTD